jgi:hypothetical protein
MSQIPKAHDKDIEKPPPIPPNPHKSNESTQVNTSKDSIIPPKPKPRTKTSHTDYKFKTPEDNQN